MPGGRRRRCPTRESVRRSARLDDAESACDEGAVGQRGVGGRVGAGRVEVAEGGRLVDPDVAAEVAREGDADVEGGRLGSREYILRCRVDRRGDRAAFAAGAAQDLEALRG